MVGQKMTWSTCGKKAIQFNWLVICLCREGSSLEHLEANIAMSLQLQVIFLINCYFLEIEIYKSCMKYESSKSLLFFSMLSSSITNVITFPLTSWLK